MVDIDLDIQFLTYQDLLDYIRLGNITDWQADEKVDSLIPAMRGTLIRDIGRPHHLGKYLSEVGLDLRLLRVMRRLLSSTEPFENDMWCAEEVNEYMRQKW